MKLPLDLNERFRRVRQVEKLPAPLWVSSDQTPLKEVRYLLPGRIIASSLCIVEGDSNAGKSTFLSHLVASITTGKPWLGRKAQAPGNVLWCNAEEEPSIFVVPRLRACGADESRVHYPELDEDGQRRRIVLPGAIGSLREAVRNLSLSLIIIEPLESHVGPEYELTHGKAARAICDPLNRLAIQTGATVIVTRGLKKTRTGPRTSHGYGHGEMILCCRSCLLIDYPDILSERRILRVIKCAGSRGTPPMSYHLSSGEGPPLMEGLSEVSQAADADDALVTDPVDRDVRNDARAMLLERCAKGTVRVATLFAAAKLEGISEKALRRARIDLGIPTEQVADDEGSYHQWGPLPAKQKEKEGGARECGSSGHVGPRAAKKPRKKK